LEVRLLFNSYQFLFLFFPITLAIYYAIGRFGVRAQNFVLIAASLSFYAAWSVRFVPLLLGSIIVNFAAGAAITACRRQGRESATAAILTLAISLNLLSIAVFKYAHFFVDNLNAVVGTGFTLGTIILPLGISFFTFEQIGFLVDVRRGEARPTDLLRYSVFVTFFPRLVAGPILRFREIEPQLASLRAGPPSATNLAVGLTIFFIGLVKKTILADGIAPYATAAFAGAARGKPVDFFLSWGGALAYTCQLYFDFSGYSDMAIGAARCFGIRFPMNFFSPYKATSIIEFWRRWHMTLSRFLRDYLYIGLGGNRRGKARRYANLLMTMLLGGLWHGSNWTFVLWGGLHGLYLMVNHAWIAVGARSSALSSFRRSRAGAAFGFVLTFAAVVVGWVLFRSPNLAAAGNMLAGMTGRQGVVIPAGFAFALQPIRSLIVELGISFGQTSGTQLIDTFLWVAVLLGVAFLAPTTQELLAAYDPVLEPIGGSGSAVPRLVGSRLLRLRWAPNGGWALAVGALGFFGTIAITRVSEFLYWQF
jgi:alginate O-acetyltransferase complex protein AlgI